MSLLHMTPTLPGCDPSLHSRSELDHLIGIDARLEHLLGIARVFDLDGAFEYDALSQLDRPFDDKLVATHERRWAVGDELVELVHKLVSSVELYIGRHSLARGVQLHPEVRGEHIRVRGQCQQVGGGLDRSKARARNDDGAGARKALNRGAHGSLKLQHLRAERERCCAAGSTRAGGAARAREAMRGGSAGHQGWWAIKPASGSVWSADMLGWRIPHP
eukprot:scaffold1650_cov124-Isochrysis_galbana.AAC.4